MNTRIQFEERDFFSTCARLHGFCLLPNMSGFWGFGMFNLPSGGGCRPNAVRSPPEGIQDWLYTQSTG